MPTRRPKVSRWTLYRDDPDAAEHPEAFEVSDQLTYPTHAWWRTANPPPKLTTRKRRRPRPPTDGAYWRNRSRKRLLSNTPLPGESKSAARTRVQRAQRYFARLDNYEYRVRHARPKTGTREWRIVLRGNVVAVTSPGQGPQKITDGRQSSPWERIAAGAQLTDMEIRQRYLEVARRAVALVAKHAPQWDEKLGTFTEARGYTKSDLGVVFPDDGVVLEVRR